MKNIKYYIITLFLIAYHAESFAQLSVSGNNPYKYEEGLSGSGIDAVYLFDTFAGASIEYESEAGFVRFFKYSRSLEDSEQIPMSQIETVKDGNSTKYILSNLEDGKGYYAEANGAVTAAIWIIDYSKHLPILHSISASESGEDCEYLRLSIDKEDKLIFYANNGGEREIVRKYKIAYDNLVWNEKDQIFEEKLITTDAFNIGIEFVIDAPLMDTFFMISGDQFAEWFKITKSIESQEYIAIATSGYIVAEQTNKDGETTSEIGGSAPANVSFYAIANEPVTHFFTWYIYKQSDTENALVRYTDKDIKYEFKEEGDYLIELEIADKESKCVQTITTNLSISKYKLEVPNFMLLDGEHTFKVSYESIIDFKCTIFNRWGNEIYSWNDPNKGWDGKYKGKYVSPGVYFYVITATSGNGKKYKKAGDINILKKK